MAVTYPLFVFEKDNQSMRQIEDPSRLHHDLEAIDVANDEYVFWDANGSGVSVAASVTTFKQKIGDVTSCVAPFPLRDAFRLYAKTVGLPDLDVEGAPSEVWSRIQKEIDARPKKRSLCPKLFR